ncbi:hypothetical protein D3C74_343680 [compost metagenome]
MLAHRGNQHILRNVEKRCIKRTEQHRRRFYEEQDFLQQILFDGNGPAFLFCQLIDLVKNQLFAFLHIDQHMLASHRFHVLCRLGNYRFRSQKTMTPAYISGLNAGDFQINNLLSEQGH